MQISTFPLTNHDLELLRNREFLLRKNHVMHDIVHYFGGLGNTLKEENDLQWLWTDTIPSAKVTRGEQHQGLPYVVLDMPRLPSGDFIALRLVFWWGYGWSVNLLVNGEQLLQRWLEQLDDRAVQPVWAKANDLWDNDHAGGGYTAMETVAGLRQYLTETGEVKSLRLLRYLPLEQHEAIPQAVKQVINDWKPVKKG